MRQYFTDCAGGHLGRLPLSVLSEAALNHRVQGVRTWLLGLHLGVELPSERVMVVTEC